LQSAKLLRERSDIVFIFIGDGARKNELESFIEQHQLDNVRVMPYQPRELVPFSLAAGNILLVTLREGLAGLSVPSKTYAILAAGRPVLFVGDKESDVARLVAEQDCGAVVGSGDSKQLAEVIAEWASNPAKLTEIGQKARRLFEQHFERHHAVDAYLESFLKCVGVREGTLLEGSQSRKDLRGSTSLRS
jgi:glycosyltransferase involved in cell wall biosynthesis